MAHDPLDLLSDDRLLALYAQGDCAAARLLTARHLPRVVGYAGRLLGDRIEAEDVAQEAMIRLWQVAPDWRPGEAAVSSWLYRVVTNLCMDQRRKLRRRQTVTLSDGPEPVDPAQGPEVEMMKKSRAQALQTALETLPERQRQAVVLRHIEGLSNPEIAAILQIGIEAVESLTARGKRALSDALMGQRVELGYEETAN